MKKSVFAMVLSVLFSLPVHAHAEKLVFVTTEFPPYIFTENGQVTGIHVEIVHEFCKRNGIEPDILSVPWKRALKEAEAGTADAVFSPKKTEEREAFLYFSSETVDSEKTSVMALKDSDIKISSLEDLKGKDIGVVRGYSYGTEFDSSKEMKKYECNDDANMVMMLGKKRFPVIIGEEGNLRLLAKKEGIEIKSLYVVEEIPNYMAFSKKALGEKGKILAEKFSETLKQLKQEGFFEKVRSKYF